MCQLQREPCGNRRSAYTCEQACTGKSTKGLRSLAHLSNCCKSFYSQFIPGLPLWVFTFTSLECYFRHSNLLRRSEYSCMCLNLSRTSNDRYFDLLSFLACSVVFPHQKHLRDKLLKVTNFPQISTWVTSFPGKRFSQPHLWKGFILLSSARTSSTASL